MWSRAKLAPLTPEQSSTAPNHQHQVTHRGAASDECHRLARAVRARRRTDLENAAPDLTIGTIPEGENKEPFKHKPSLFMYEVGTTKEPQTVVVSTLRGSTPDERLVRGTSVIRHYCIHASNRTYYDICQRVLIGATLLVEPLRLSFGQGMQLLVVATFLMDVAFVTDMPVNALTTVVTHERVEITDSRALVKNYVVSYHGVLSFCLMMPILTTGCTNDARYWVGATLRSLRVLRWWIQSRGRSADRLGRSKERVVMLVAYFGMYCHILCCWMYGLWEAQTTVPNAALYAPLHVNRNGTAWSQYTSCFSTVLLYLKTGCPINGSGGGSERLFEVVCNFSALVCLGMLIGELTLVMQSMRADSQNYEHKKNKLTRFLERRSIPMELRKEAYAFYEHQHRLQNDSDKEILHTLPSSQVYEIRSYMLQNMFERVQILQDADPHLLRTVMIKCRNDFFFQGDVVHHEGDIDDSMYFLMRGEVEMRNVHDEVVTTLCTGSHFGDLQLFEGNGRCATTAIAARYCDTCVLERSDLMELLERFPEEKEIMNRIAQNRMRQMRKGGPYRDSHVVERVLIQTAVQKHGGQHAHAPKHLMSRTQEKSYTDQRRPALVGVAEKR